MACAIARFNGVGAPRAESGPAVAVDPTRIPRFPNGSSDIREDYPKKRETTKCQNDLTSTPVPTTTSPATINSPSASTAEPFLESIEAVTAWPHR